MNLFNAMVVGLKEIWAHKFRSGLTMLGIILGVSSLIGMSALVKGMENGMRENMVAMGGPPGSVSALLPTMTPNVTHPTVITRNVTHPIPTHPAPVKSRNLCKSIRRSSSDFAQAAC